MRRIRSFPNLALPRSVHSVYLVSPGALKTFLVDVTCLELEALRCVCLFTYFTVFLDT